ncbi:alkaline phosphatase family protein [Pseudarthrobacter sp. AL07]|uniref:alkaline phosphatase family protein n=1 Tax=unclassified Pseudarthrobacter TaxID=2647000 RepID=UPI00249B8EB3|nr:MULTISPECIES: alkaline phosphatase family protein [unclassified Pseudarthrobacter]MDI3195474.1 alkaline phosphatase family protein [Pseudarthrobacter sp. AL20]MDI3209541.1 alkaline phosphatase family protein [Pseudarthrobacter sp. AL07]
MKSKILVVGIDGLVLERALDSGRAPTLAALNEAGTVSALTMEAPTLSGPGWSTLLTGSSHEQHGVRDNLFAGHRLLLRPDLLSRAFYQDQSTTTFAAAGWPPLVDPAGIGPVIHERREQQRAGLHRMIARDGETYGYRTVDGEIAEFAVYALNKSGPDVSFVYFCEVDDASHLNGAVGEHYLDAISRIDAHLARLRAALETRAHAKGERWLMVLTTDHGHLDEGGHGLGSARERASFVIATGIGRNNPDWPDVIAPESLVPLLLAERNPAGNV